MTLTERKRNKHPARYARKDARTAIYRVVYGLPDPGPRSNDPSVDTRHLPYNWTHADAEHTFKANVDKAEFTSAQVAHLERRLDQLRSHKGAKS